MREFVTAVREADPEPEEGLDEIKVDGRICQFHRPNDGQVAMFMASIGRHSSTADRAAGAVDMFLALFDEDDRQWFVSRMWDSNDDFGVTEITSIFHALVEEWSGRPTSPSTGSTQSRQTGGRRSTRRTPASI